MDPAIAKQPLPASLPGVFPAPIPAQGLLEGETVLFRYSIPLPAWAVVAVLLASGLLFHFVLRAILVRWARKTATGVDDIVVDVAGKAVPAAVVLVALYVAVETLDEKAHGILRGALLRAAGVGLILLVAWSVTTLLLRAVRRWAERHQHLAQAYPPARVAIKALGVLVAGVTVLAYLNVNVTALATTLGLGGLAVALSLRDTLENFFAGLHVMADQPFREGDWVEVHETGDRGVVLRIGWRSTRIRTLDNNLLVVPNLKLASGLVTNITARDPRIHVRVQVGVDYASDPDRVAAILEEEARAGVGSVPGLLADPAPEAALHPGFGPSSLDFTLRVTVDRMESVGGAQDLLRRRILKRLRAEGIGIPFPTTTVRLEKPE